MLLTDRIEIHQSQPLAWPSNFLYTMLAGCDWWISIRHVDNTKDWQKFWKRFRECFVFQSRVSTKTVVNSTMLSGKHNSASLRIYFLPMQMRLSDWEIRSQRQVAFAFHHHCRLLNTIISKISKIERQQRVKLRERQLAYSPCILILLRLFAHNSIFSLEANISAGAEILQWNCNKISAPLARLKV